MIAPITVTRTNASTSVLIVFPPDISTGTTPSSEKVTTKSSPFTGSAASNKSTSKQYVSKSVVLGETSSLPDLKEWRHL